MATKRRTVSIDEDLDDDLEDEARAQDRPVSSLLSTYARAGLAADPVRRARLKKRKAA